jgi:hypothetical protein
MTKPQRLLTIALETLEQIATQPRGSHERRLASSSLAFIKAMQKTRKAPKRKKR